MAQVSVRESEIEDVFATYPSILENTLGWDGALSLVARQREVQSGRLDLLFVSRSELVLVELKVVPYSSDAVQQVLTYRDDLRALQEEGELIKGEVNAFLLVTSCGTGDVKTAEAKGVVVRRYDPAQVLEAYYQQVLTVSDYLQLKPKDYGVWHVHVVNRVLYALTDHNTIPSLAEHLKLAPNTVRNHLRFAERLGLVSRLESKYLLTDLGRGFVGCRDVALSVFQLSERQIQLLRQYTVRDPFASNIVFGLYSLVEAVFTLARNSYPVHIEDVIPYFRESVGKRHDWSTPRAAFLGANAFCNFAVELGLVARVGPLVFLTPSGLSFILLLQLHKGIQLVDSLGIGTTRTHDAT